MKNKILKNQFVVLFFLILTVQTASAKTAKKVEAQEDWPAIFASEIKKSQSKLGPKCFYKSDAEYKAAIKKQKPDADLKITHAEFLNDLKKNGIIASYNQVVKNFETQPLCHLTESEYLALRMYTGSYYRQINSALRQLNLSEIKKFKLVIKFLMAGLAKLQNYEGVTKRGTSLNSQMVTECQAGSAFADRGFLSTSVASGFGGQYRFILASKSCKYVAPFSSYPNEEEVLCLPGTIFQIRYMNQQPTNTEVILQEAGQRFDLDDLIQTLEANPELQNPQADAYWSKSCQPESVIFDKDTLDSSEEK